MHEHQGLLWVYADSSSSSSSSNGGGQAAAAAAGAMQPPASLLIPDGVELKSPWFQRDGEQGRLCKRVAAERVRVTSGMLTRTVCVYTKSVCVCVGRGGGEGGGVLDWH